MPRAQYIGYTATPFANVFINPDDSQDLFPSDFVLSLRTPDGYVGAGDLFDLQTAEAGRESTLSASNEKAFIRGVWDDRGGQLQEAIDAFLLSGALKLYRGRHGADEGPFRHHTMLVHESVRTADHRELADRVKRMWDESAPLTRSGLQRLRTLYEQDFVPVSSARAGDSPMPASFEELRGDIARARQMIKEDGPVRVVNGDKNKDYEDVDFDRTDRVWKIIVGGTKLSRGFTVEGLTVSYYRRPTKQADTLMQMARWFGYRPGYADLVRLYLGRDESSGQTSVDILEAFRAACLDEEDFRGQLRRYATMENGRPQVTPSNVLPMVRQTLPWLKPTAVNKMWNTELVGMTAPGDAYEPKMYPLGPDARANLEVWAPVLAEAGEESTGARMPSGRAVLVKATTIGHDECVSLLKRLKWQDRGAQLEPYLRGLEEAGTGSNAITDWLVLFPQLKSSNAVRARLLGFGPFTLSTRSHLGKKGALGRIAPGNDRTDIEDLMRRALDGATLGPTLDVGPHRGVILAYPMVQDKLSSQLSLRDHDEIDPEQVAIGTALMAPRSSSGGRYEVRFRAKGAGDAAIVERPTA
nr:Z1 domain-containing protein [Glycomyces amatae]